MQYLALIKTNFLQLITDRDMLNMSSLSRDSIKACACCSMLPHRLHDNIKLWNNVQCFWAMVWHR